MSVHLGAILARPPAILYEDIRHKSKAHIDLKRKNVYISITLKSQNHIQPKLRKQQDHYAKNTMHASQ